MSYNELDISRLGSLLLLIFSFPYKLHFSINQYKLLIGIGLYLFVLQVGKGLNIAYISSFVDSFYPIEMSVWKYGELSSFNDLAETRFGGVFYNPNIMGQSMVLLFVFLLKYLISNDSRKYIKIIVFLLFFTSILLTGSRTSMFTFLVISYFAFHRGFSKKLIRASILILLFFGIFLIPDLDKFISNFRVFNVNTMYNDQGSGFIKINILLDWLSDIFSNKNFNIFKVFFGIGSIPTQFDFDLGYILEMFGFMGFFVLTLFFVKIFKKTISEYRFVFFLFLISLGATVIINFRFSILLIMIFSLYNERNNLNNE